MYCYAFSTPFPTVIPTLPSVIQISYLIATVAKAEKSFAMTGIYPYNPDKFNDEILNHQ